MDRNDSGVPQASSCPLYLPERLVAARAAALDRLNCLDLSRTARQALWAILAFCNSKQPKRNIYPSRDTLLRACPCMSERTLYRGLALLEKAGYIVRRQLRKQIGRWRTGEFHLSVINLTDKALALLGLNAVIHNDRPASLADGYKEERSKEKRQSLKRATEKPAIETSAPRLPSSRVPKDLEILLAHGLRRTGIWKLMRLATQSGKRLSDIVAVIRHRLSAIYGDGSVYAYLHSLIRKDLDYAHAAKVLNEERQTVRCAEEVRAKLKSFDYRYHGFSVLRRDGTLLGVLETDVGLYGTSTIRTQQGSIPLNQQFIEALSNGNIQIQRKDVFYA